MPELVEILIDRPAIANRVNELGRQISADYAGRELLVVGVLTGAFIFTADLVRALDLDLEVDFIRVASYGAATCSSGQVSLTKDLECQVSARDLLLVEDIVDTGRTLAWLKAHLLARNPASLKVCALIDKSERREVAVEVDYVGFPVAEGFLVGYGLDCGGRYRQLPDIRRLGQ
ncbi:MAG TPA: hypoxanthine phosphoribosyltransferase [Desulfurivibrionaceae bacterium]|nr:hypoxanthine phosphoribosyltransferase [Desulfurivibrionaceae bacterium]